MGLELVLSISDPVEVDGALLPLAKGEALESMGGLKDWYTALAMEGTNSGHSWHLVATFLMKIRLVMKVQAFR